MSAMYRPTMSTIAEYTCSTALKCICVCTTTTVNPDFSNRGHSSILWHQRTVFQLKNIMYDHPIKPLNLLWNICGPPKRPWWRAVRDAPIYLTVEVTSSIIIRKYFSAHICITATEQLLTWNVPVKMTYLCGMMLKPI